MIFLAQIRALLNFYATVPPSLLDDIIAGTYERPTGPGSDLVLTDVDIAEQTAHLTMELKALDFLDVLLSTVRMSWWGKVKLGAKLIPVVGWAWLVFKITSGLAKLAIAIQRLQLRLSTILPVKKSMPVVRLQFCAKPITDQQPVPLLAYGQTWQEISVYLNPVSDNGQVTVYVKTTDDTAIEIGQTFLLFPERYAGSRILKVRARQKETKKSPKLLFSFAPTPTEANSTLAPLNIRGQAIHLDPEKGNIYVSKPSDSLVINVWMNAILDDSTVVYFVDTTTSAEDPAPTKKLKFDPESLTFTRPTVPNTHFVNKQQVTITLVNKTTLTAEGITSSYDNDDVLASVSGLSLVDPPKKKTCTAKNDKAPNPHPLTRK